MSDMNFIRSFIEIGIAVLLVFGVIYEDKVADFEEKISIALKRAIRRKCKIINLKENRPQNNKFKAV